MVYDNHTKLQVFFEHLSRKKYPFKAPHVPQNPCAPLSAIMHFVYNTKTLIPHFLLLYASSVYKHTFILNKYTNTIARDEALPAWRASAGENNATAMYRI
jgi:hypothetical protein